MDGVRQKSLQEAVNNMECLLQLLCTRDQPCIKVTRGSGVRHRLGRRASEDRAKSCVPDGVCKSLSAGDTVHVHSKCTITMLKRGWVVSKAPRKQIGLKTLCTEIIILNYILRKKWQEYKEILNKNHLPTFTNCYLVMFVYILSLFLKKS